MSKPQFTLLATLLAGGVAFAGPIDKNVITPEPVCGPFYVSAYGGGSFFDDGVYSSNSNVANGSSTTNFGEGWIAGLAFGIRTERQMRFEVDLNHSQAPADYGYGDAFGFNFYDGPLGGDVERTSLFLNAIKEFGAGRIHPYVGAGAGLTNVQADIIEPTFSGQVGEVDDVVFGYQFMGGVAYDIGSCFQTYLEYRLMGHGDVEDSQFLGNYGPTDFGWGQHIILGGRWFF